MIVTIAEKSVSDHSDQIDTSLLTIPTSPLNQNSKQSDTEASNSGTDHEAKSIISYGLTIFCRNINSLAKHLDEIRIAAAGKQPHVSCLNETKVDDSFADNDLEIEDYVINRKDRTINSAGVAIYLQKSIQYNLRQDLNDFDLETVAVELRLPYVKPIVIATLYRPEGPVEVFNRIEAMVSKISEEKKGIYFDG